MKKISALLLLLPILLMGAEGKNLLLNGDFSQKLRSWIPRSKEGLTILEKAGPTGKNALKAVSTKGVYIANYSVKFKPDTDYTLRGWIKSEGNAQVYLYFCQTPNAGKFHSKSLTLTKPTDWTKVNVLLNSGKAKGMVVLLRVVGKHKTNACFSDLEVLEGNHLPQDNLFANSDFKRKTRYEKIPDTWTPAVYVSIVDPDNFVYELAPNVKAPVKGAGVLRIRSAIAAGQRIQQTVAGQTYTYSFYAKNAVKNKRAKVRYLFGRNRKELYLTDKWTRYSISGKATHGFTPARVQPLKTKGKYEEFLFSAPQLVIGSSPVPWTPPKPQKQLAVMTIKEAAARADSKRISGEPTARDWNNAPTYEHVHLTKGKHMGRAYTHTQLLHNKTHLFALFTCKEDPGIKVGDKTRLNWERLCDTVELFITDRAGDSTYIHAAVNKNSHNYMARNFQQQVLGIQTKVTKKKGEWTALFKVPLSLFHTNKEWKVGFGRVYNHTKYGRIAMDWSLPGSRHNTAKFGLLYGVNVEKRAVMDLTGLHADLNHKNLVYYFANVPKDFKGATLTASLHLRGKTLWKKSMPFAGKKGLIPIPANYEKLTETGTSIALKVTKNGKDLYMGSRVFYLLFSSYAKYNKDMELFPKYNIFTPNDKFVTLKSNLNKKVFDALNYEIRNEKGKVVASGKAAPTTRIPIGKFANGRYTIYAKGMKKGKVMEERNHFTFRVLPFFQYMVRMDHEQGNLETPKKALLPMAYYSVGSPNYPWDPLISTLPPKFFEGVKKHHFDAIKCGYHFAIRKNGAQLPGILESCRKYDLSILLDMEGCFPKDFYSHSPAAVARSAEECGKIMVTHTAKVQKLFAGKPGILAYAPYHEPGYFRNGKGVVDSYYVPRILPELQKADPYRPITGFWAPPHWDANGEPFGSVDGVDFFIVDIYTRNLERHCDELFRIAKASRVVRKPIGQIFNVDNLGTDDRDAPTPAEYRAEVYTALIAGYRVFYFYVGIPGDKNLWKEMVECNKRLDVFSKYLCNDACKELISVNGLESAYSIHTIGDQVLVMTASKSNDKKVNFSLDVEKIVGSPLKNGKELFGGKKITLKNGLLKTTLPPAGCNAWIFSK